MSPARLDLATTFPASTRRDERGGVGFLFAGGVLFDYAGQKLRLIALDLDACRDPLTDQITEWAVDIIENFGRSYTEVSPSGYGLRVFILVPVDAVPPHLHAVGRASESAPGCEGKKPGVQLFGHNDVPSYVTVTGRRLVSTTPEIRVVQAIDWLIAAYGLATTGESGPTVMPAGRGAEPTNAEITERVLASKNGRELIAAEWQKVMPTKSASEAYYVLVRAALRAANGHGEVVADWLVHCTAWGMGWVVESKGPHKYARPTWVRKEVARIAGKHGEDVDPASAFEALEEAPPSPVSSSPSANSATATTGQPATVASATPSGDPLAVLDEWEHDGPLVHLPTGIASLDAATGGGLVLGSRVYLVGAPDAGKTALAVQLLDTYLAAGIPVGILAIDEEPGDVTTRLLQRRGLTRVECEQRAPSTLRRARELLTGLPLRIYGAASTIEAAMVDLHRLAKARRPNDDRPACVMFVDSVQVARCECETGDESPNRAVSARVAAIRAGASRFRMLVVATSEMNRGAYRSRKLEDNSADMAAAKESGAIEFSARVMLTLRSVKDVPDVVECRVTKNKHGPSTREGEDGIFLRFDRAAQTMAEDGEFVPVDTESAAADERVDAAARLALLIVQQESVGRNAAVSALAGTISERRVKDARAWLVEVGAIRETVGKNRLRAMELVSTKLPPDVRKRLEQLLAG